MSKMHFVLLWKMSKKSSKNEKKIVI